MRTIVEKEWLELPVVWNELFDKNGSTTPYQSYFADTPLLISYMIASLVQAAGFFYL